jgi:hypothetical protein
LLRRGSLPFRCNAVAKMASALTPFPLNHLRRLRLVFARLPRAYGTRLTVVDLGHCIDGTPAIQAGLGTVSVGPHPDWTSGTMARSGLPHCHFLAVRGSMGGMPQPLAVEVVGSPGEVRLPHCHRAQADPTRGIRQRNIRSDYCLPRQSPGMTLTDFFRHFLGWGRLPSPNPVRTIRDRFPLSPNTGTPSGAFWSAFI